MRNSIEDSDGYRDPDSLSIDEVPKTMQFAPTLEYQSQVITVERVDNSEETPTEDQDESKVNSTQESFQSQNKTGYKYAFGSRVKEEDDFDKGLGIVGMNKQTMNQKRNNTATSSKKSESDMPRGLTKANVTDAKKKVIAKKTVPKPDKKATQKTDQKPVKGILKVISYFF